jgi:dihydrofolate synthase/folylpolyglutamate synthase
MLFEEALSFLNSRRNFELSRNFESDGLFERLSRLRELLDFLGKPDRRYKIVHVAGTKGKGSTCIFLEGILMSAGVNVGRFMSPHLYSFLERVTVNGVSCSESEFAEIMFYIKEQISKFDVCLLEELTFFELLLVFAFEYFVRCGVDVVLLEVGLGGRFDATNICLPDVTVITNLSFDHIEQLGPTLRDIAREKGGIIKSGIPLVSSVCEVEPRVELCSIIESRGALSYFLGDSFVVEPITVSESFKFRTIQDKFPVQIELDDLDLCMFGKHQRQNASLAIAASLLLRDEFNVDADVIRKGLAKAFLPARIEVFRGGVGEPTFVVDGAHNRASVEMLIDTLCGLFPRQRKLLVFGTTIGKDIDGMLMELLQNFEMVFMTQYSSSPRRFPPFGLQTIAETVLSAPNMKNNNMCKMEVILDSSLALSKCFELADKDDVVCVTGSIYLAAELRDFYLKNRG